MEKEDIVERLVTDSAVLISYGKDFSDTLLDAANTIKELRNALHTIGYDYVELSHEKVNWLYLEHIQIAKKAYIKSFPEQDDIPKPKKLDDNF